MELVKTTVPAALSTILETQSEAEAELLARAQAGEVEAFGEVCRRYETPLLRQALTLGCEFAAAEDLAQETLVEAWKSLRRYNGSCRFYTWLCAILLNRRRSLLRRKPLLLLGDLLWARGEDAGENIKLIPAREPGPDEAAQSSEEARLIQRCLAALPAKQQQVVYLRFYAGDSLEGIAAALGCRIGTVKSRLFHALERLRRMKALPARAACTTQASEPGPKAINEWVWL
jgi:RNA polymerase sigma-70 factor, ECF subfamily